MLAHTTTPIWTQVAVLHADWVNSRGLQDSIALTAFLKHLSDALQIGLVKVEVCGDCPAIQAGDQCVVGEWRLAGHPDALRAALQAPQVDVRGFLHV